MDRQLTPAQEADRMNNFVMTLLAKETLTYILFVEKGEQWFTKEHKRNLSFMKTHIQNFVTKVESDMKMNMQLNGVNYTEILKRMDMNIETSYLVSEVVRAIMTDEEARELIYKALNCKEVDDDGRVIPRPPRFPLSKADIIDLIMLYNPASTLHIPELNTIRKYKEYFKDSNKNYFWDYDVLKQLSEEDLFTFFRTIKDKS